MTEEWRPVPGFENQYRVSNFGQVFSVRSGRVLRPGRMSSGHLSVSLGRGNTVCVHALVLLAFVGDRPEGKEARHINGVPADNALSNLEWATRSRNAQDKKWHAGAKGYKLRPQAVLHLREKRKAGASVSDLAEEFGVGKTTVYYAIKGKRFHRDV